MKLKAVLFFVIIFNQIQAQTKPELRYADKIRIKEAVAISTQFGDQLFTGYSAVPFTIDLITDSTEFLINHPTPSADFILLEKDSVLNTNIYYRKRQFDPHLLATFPAVNGLSCIVVGTPENTHKNSTEWIITLLHEHFHQYQNTDTNYYKSVEGLNLSGGDQTGMWMLNYPFPYDSLPVKKQYEKFTNALYKTVTNVQTKNFTSYLAEYLTERRRFKAILSARDYRYFSFQIWQEGLARYTEFNFLERLAHYQPSPEVRKLPDFLPFGELKSTMYRNEMKNLLQNKLDETKRVCFYSVGFAEGLLLDQLNKSWRNQYLQDKFYIEHYINK